MKSAIHTFRVRYGETDKMGFVYYGNYAEYFEVGRVELFRNLGISYKKLEDNGILMPVLEMTIKYIKPIKYDDEFFLKTTLTKIEGLKIYFDYEITNSENELTTIGSTKLLFISSETMKPIKVPDEILKIINA